MKRTGKRNSRLKYLIILLLLTAIIFGSSTYAWFTANRIVTVGSLDVNVTTVTGIQISVDGINWKSSITKQDLLGATATYAANTNQIPSTMEPVSTGLNLIGATGKIAMFRGSVAANESTGIYELTSTASSEAAGTGGYFIAFDVFLKSSTAVDDLYLSTASGAKYYGSKSSVGLENATRIVLIKEGNVADGTAAATIQGLATEEATDIYMWEPNYTSHTAAAVSNASATYGLTTTTTAANNSLLPYSGVMAAFATGVPLSDCTEDDDDTKFVDLVPTYTTAANFTSNLKIFGLSAGITKIKVYMWIEGQDVDCENNASGTDIRFDLQFTLDA